MPSGISTPSGAVAALRRFTRTRPAGEFCELCARALPDGHEHLIEPATLNLLCACTACAILFPGREGARFKRVRRMARRLGAARLDDRQWAGLDAPVGAAFFIRSSAHGKVISLYPGPAGLAHSEPPPEAWQALESALPELGSLEPDVEALLCNRICEPFGCFAVSIDECFRLAGALRSAWRGLTGGPEARQAVEFFFSDLLARASGAESPGRSCLD